MTIVDVVQYYEVRRLSRRKMFREKRLINQAVMRLLLIFPIGELANWCVIAGREDCR